MVANGSEPREILLDPMIAGSSRGTDGCVFDREVDRECSPRVDSLDVMGSVELVEEPAQNSAAIACATSEAVTFRFGEQNPFRRLVATAAMVTAPTIVETGAMVGTGTDGEVGRLAARPPPVLTVGEMLGMEIGGRALV